MQSGRMQELGLATRAIHGGQCPDETECKSVVTPIVTSVTYRQSEAGSQRVSIWVVVQVETDVLLWLPLHRDASTLSSVTQPGNLWKNAWLVWRNASTPLWCHPDSVPCKWWCRYAWRTVIICWCVMTWTQWPSNWCVNALQGWESHLTWSTAAIWENWRRLWNQTPGWVSSTHFIDTLS